MPGSTSEAPAPTLPAGGRRPWLTRGGAVAVGLVLTLVGLFVLGDTLPTAPGTLERAVAVTGLGVVALWVGGIFLGASRGR